MVRRAFCYARGTALLLFVVLGVATFVYVSFFLAVLAAGYVSVTLFSIFT